MNLPTPSQGMDEHGGWTFSAPQWWWGHQANKATWLYIVGCGPRDLPAIPLALGDAPRVIASSSCARGRSPTQGGKSGLSKRGREATPEAFARWLVDLARRCSSTLNPQPSTSP